MKRTRRHSNTTGQRKVKTGKTASEVKRIARRLRIPYDDGKKGGTDGKSSR